jgi:signal transduction histidine kinase
MKHLLLIFYLSIPFALKAQSTRTIDSLKMVLSKLPARQSSYQTDTIRVRVLCAIADKFNNPDSTIKYAQQAKLIAKRLNWVDGEFESGFRVGKSLKNKGLYYKALDSYIDLQIFLEKNINKKRLAIILREIADVYYLLQEYPQSIERYHTAMNIFKSLQEYEEYADTQNNLALSYYQIKKYQKSIQLLENCLTYLPYIKGKMSEISFYDNLSLVHAKINHFAIALEYSQKSLKKYELLGEQYNLIKSRSLLQIALLFQRLNKVEKALDYANQVKAINSKYGGNNLDLNQLYYEIYKRQGKYILALKYLELFKKAQEDKFQLEKSQTVKSLQSVYDLEKEKDKVLLLNTNLEKENLQKKVGIIGLIIITGFLIFAYRSYVNQKRKSKQIEEQRFAIQELNNSLENKVVERTQELSNANQELIQKNKEISEALFKGQSIERTRVASALHDNIGGTMAALKWMLESIDTENLSKNDKSVYKNALNITSDAYSDVRFMSHNFIPEVLAQLGLQDAVKKLCQEISQTKRLEMSFGDNTFSEFSHQIELEIYSICLELTTNILKHSKATHATILMQENDDYLEVIVTDNGIGISNEGINGKGLKNIRKRLEAIKGTVVIKSTLNETSCFSMRIPLAIREEYMNLRLAGHKASEEINHNLQNQLSLDD